MIDRSEILEAATDLSLAPEVVEKDYVLAWLLAGIHRNEELAGATDEPLGDWPATGEPRSYRLDRIESAQATSQPFTPRYAVELAPIEARPIPLAATVEAVPFRDVGGQGRLFVEEAD